MQITTGIPLLTGLAALVWSATAAAQTSDGRRTAAEPQVTSPAAATKESDTPAEPEHLRLGVLGGVGFPRPLAIEGMIKIERTLALGAEYSLLPEMTVSGVRTTFWAAAADARLFPFRGAFFIGLRAGHQHLDGTTTVTVPSYGSITESLGVDTWFVNPRVGFLWTSSVGLSIGLEAGVQIPITSSTSSTLPPSVTVSDGLTSVTNALGKNVLPTFDLLRVGFLF